MFLLFIGRHVTIPNIISPFIKGHPIMIISLRKIVFKYIPITKHWYIQSEHFGYFIMLLCDEPFNLKRKFVICRGILWTISWIQIV